VGRAAELGVELVDLDRLFAEADVVSLHTPWLPETEGLIAGRHFERLRPGATFINTARGAVVREPEMTAVLQRRPEVYAVLDVTWPEPPAAGSPLYTLPNVFLTPHMAGSMGPECRRMGRFMADELGRYLRGDSLLGEVTREAAARLA
jgi:phosphoglycerate dehydrogenase-like enzyme